MPGWGSLEQGAIAFAAALLAGAINAMAGGGTNVAFFGLLWQGLPPIKANATTAVALWPGRAGGAWGFRHELAKTRHWWFWLVVPSLAGGILGAYLLVHSPPDFFKRIAPYLVLASTLLVAIEPWVRKWLHSGADQQRSIGWRVLAIGVQFVVSIYGGYFGAGLGLLILFALGLLGLHDLDRANGLKNVFGLVLKGADVVFLAFTGTVIWSAAIVMAVGAIAGGYGGAVIAHKLSEKVMRGLIVLIGIAVAVAMYLHLAT